MAAALAGPAADEPKHAPLWADVVAGDGVIKPGMVGGSVSRTQMYLNGVGIPVEETGVYDRATRKAVEWFQEKFFLAPWGNVNQRTAQTLRHVYGTGRLPKFCRTEAKVVCVDKTQKTARLMKKGDEELVFDVRFGAEQTPTRNGHFRIYAKDRYLISDLTGTPMPFSLFFSGGQALHYSQLFHRDGYSGASHGCVNIRSKPAAKYLFNHTEVGTPVFIYRS